MATKILHPHAGRGDRRRLLAQARRSRAAGDGRVLAPLVVQADRRRPAAVWPWMAGRDLAARVARHGRLESTWAVMVADEIACAVEALHRRGLAHGALTADHVLLDSEGHAALIGLDPRARTGADGRATDLRAAEALRRMLLGEDSTPSNPDAAVASPTARPAPDLALAGGASPRGRRALVPLAAGLLVTAMGTAIGITGSGSDCPPVPESTELSADVDGDGCADRLDWSPVTGRLLADTADGRRGWQLGEPGDRFVLGDWNCDGTRTPGLHRPATGRTYGFDHWPTKAAAASRLVDERQECPPTGSP